VTSTTTFAYYRSNIIHHAADPHVDYYMLLVVLLKQTMPDVKMAETLLYDMHDTHINHAKMMSYLQRFQEEKLGLGEYAPLLTLLADIKSLAELNRYCRKMIQKREEDGTHSLLVDSWASSPHLSARVLTERLTAARGRPGQLPGPSIISQIGPTLPYSYLESLIHCYALCDDNLSSYVLN